MPDTRTLVQVEMIVVAISTQSTAIHEIVFRKEILCNCAKFTFSFFHIDTVLIKRNPSTSYSKANDTPNYYTMSPSYQTVPLAAPPKVEPSSTSVSMMKKVAVAAMVGTAFLAGNSYARGSNAAPLSSVTGGPPDSVTGNCPGDQTLFAVQNIKPDDALNANHPGEPFQGDPKVICGQVCLTPFEASTLSLAPHDIQINAFAATTCFALGYPVFNNEFSRILFLPGTAPFLIPIYKKEAVTDDDHHH